MRRLLALSCDAALASSAPLWAAGLHVAVLAAFVAAWGDGAGVPAWFSWTFYAQMRVIELALLAVLLPWTAARVLPSGGIDARTRLSGLTGAAPSSLLLARAAGGFCAASLVSLSALPVAVLAQRLSGGSLLRAGVDEAALLGITAAAVVVHLWVERRTGDPVKIWIMSAVVLAAAGWISLRITPGPAVAAISLAAAASISLGWLARTADHEDLYLTEPAA